MRSNPHKFHGRSPAARLGEWLSTHLTRGIVAAIFCTAYWFFINPGLINFIKFVDSGGGGNTSTFVIDPNYVLGIQIVGCLVICFLMLGKKK